MYSLGTLWSYWRKYELHNRSDITRTVVWVFYCFIPTCKISSGSFFVQTNQSLESSSVGSSSERSYFFRVFPIHQEYLKNPKQNCDTGLWYYCNSKISLVHNHKDGKWILHFHSTRLRYHFPGLRETDNTEIGYNLIMTYWRHGIELYVLMSIGCHCYFSVLPVNISTPLIQRAQQSVDTLLNDVREMGFSKYTKTSSESR